MSVSNKKYMADNFIVIANKYGREYLAFRVATANGNKNIFRMVEQIYLSEKKIQAW